MKIPKYWAQETVSTRDPEGRPYRLSTWRWSDVSNDDARQLALARVMELGARVEKGETLNRYSYGDRPLREEAVRAVAGDGNRELGVITRNAYGALVLNATQALFVDIDFPQGGSVASLPGPLRRLSGKPQPSQEDRALANLKDWAARNPGLGLRVYRTFGGLRGLITNELFDPANDSTRQILQEMNADPLYVKLCRDQQCFRARLSPKPWRCNAQPPPSRFPWPDARAELAYRSWEEKFQAIAARFDVCRLLAQFGSPEVHPDIAPVLSAHDQACLSGRNLPLA